MNTVGDPISAEEAFEYGLANRVLEDHELFDAALGVGAEAVRPGAVGGRGDQARLRTTPTSTKGLAAERDAFLRVHGSEDGREGVAAFIEKRAPKFTGR